MAAVTSNSNNSMRKSFHNLPRKRYAYFSALYGVDRAQERFSILGNVLILKAWTLPEEHLYRNTLESLLYKYRTRIK